ncbi:MAG: hypothetical protein ACRDZY_15225, partial [Acidimicrobiales bacterium]
PGPRIRLDQVGAGGNVWPRVRRLPFVVVEAGLVAPVSGTSSRSSWGGWEGGRRRAADGREQRSVVHGERSKDQVTARNRVCTPTCERREPKVSNPVVGPVSGD